MNEAIQLEFDFMSDEKEQIRKQVGKQLSEAVNKVFNGDGKSKPKRENIVGHVDLEKRKREAADRRRKEKERIRFGDSPEIANQLLEFKKGLREK